MSHQIEIYKTLRVPGVLAYAALRTLLSLSAEHADSPISNAAALGIQGFRTLGNPEVHVPVTIDATPIPIRWEANIEISALRHPELYPHFAGTLTITPNGIEQCEVWLMGEYQVPLGTVGDVIDRTLLRDVAQGSLSDFLTRLAEKIDQQVRQTEHEHERAMRARHGD